MHPGPGSRTEGTEGERARATARPWRPRGVVARRIWLWCALPLALAIVAWLLLAEYLPSSDAAALSVLLSAFYFLGTGIALDPGCFTRADPVLPEEITERLRGIRDGAGPSGVDSRIVRECGALLVRDVPGAHGVMGLVLITTRGVLILGPRDTFPRERSLSPPWVRLVNGEVHLDEKSGDLLEPARGQCDDLENRIRRMTGLKVPICYVYILPGALISSSAAWADPRIILVDDPGVLPRLPERMSGRLLVDEAMEIRRALEDLSARHRSTKPGKGEGRDGADPDKVVDLEPFRNMFT